MKDFFNKLLWFLKSILKNIIKLIESIGFSKAFGRPLKYFSYLPLTYQWEDIIKKSPKIEGIYKNSCSKKVLIAPVVGFYEAPLALETVVAKSLQLSGADVKILSCSFGLPAYAKDPAGNNKPYFAENKVKKFSFNELDLCKLSNNNIEKLCKILEIDELKLEKYQEESDIKKAILFLETLNTEFDQQIIYKDIDISEHAKSTALRKLARGDLVKSNKYHKAVYYRYLLASIIYIDLLERSFSKFRPDSVFAIHGIYLEHGVLRDFARKEKVPIYIWGFPYRKNAIMVSVNDTYHRTYLHEKNSVWSEIDMSENMKLKLHEYIDSKLSGGKDYVNYHPNPILDKKKIYEELKLDPNKQLVSMYTNVLWDAQIFYPSSLFDGLLEWISETIKFYSGNKDVELVVRIHPAESKGGLTTDQPLAEEIRKIFPTLPDNLRIIEPESDISSYILSDISDLSIVYGSNIALEIALRGNPLVIAGEAFCRGKGFSIDPQTKDEYFNILSKPKIVKGNSAEQIELAEKYAYHWNFRRVFNFDYVTTSVSGKNMSRDVILNFNSYEDLKAGNNKGLDIVNNLLLGKSDIYYEE